MICSPCLCLVCFSQNMHHFIFHVTYTILRQFEIPKEFPKNSQRIPKEFPKNSQKIPKDSKIIHKKFPKMSSENSQKILWRFPNNSKKKLTRAYRSKSFSSLFCYTRCQTLIHTQLVVDITVLYTVQYYYFPGKNPF